MMGCCNVRYVLRIILTALKKPKAFVYIHNSNTRTYEITELWAYVDSKSKDWLAK